MSWLLDEDNALRSALRGLTVSDEKNSSRAVGVWFGMPDPEIRAQQFPFITIDLVGLSEERDRVISGPFYKRTDTRPDGVPVPTDSQTVVGELPPTPYTLEYQITTYARFPRHDRQLLSALLSNTLSLRWGTLVVPEDQSKRRLDVVGMNKRDTVDPNGRRLFRNVFTVRVSSELYVWQVAAVEKARSVSVSLTRLPA